MQICHLLLLAVLTSVVSADFVRPTQIVIKRYAFQAEYQLESEQRYELILETTTDFYLKLKQAYHFIAKVPKSDLSAEVVDGHIVLSQSSQLQIEYAYLIFFPSETYPVIDESESGYRIEYAISKTHIKCSVGTDYFELEQGVTKQTELSKEEDAICVISFSDGSAGSGFLLESNGVLYCISNQHVIANPYPMEIKLIDGTKLDYGSIDFAQDRDLARIRITGQHPAFRSVRKPELEESIRVLGNSYGAGRVTVLSGKVTGLNELEMETSAKFVPGNSGSPIISDDKEVLAVATLIDTYAQDDTFMKGTEFEGGRRVGIRLDDAIEWIPVDMTTFRSRNRLLFQIEDYVAELPDAFSAVAAANESYKINSSAVTNRHLKQWLQLMNQRLANTIREHENQISKAIADQPRSYPHSTAHQHDIAELNQAVRSTARSSWNSMRQQLQVQLRSLKTTTPQPDTVYLRNHMQRLQSVLEAALIATQRIQKNLAD
ncbi:S1 family peptidase [Coraliomargarita akajimensis]|uniref:Trypsin-like protein serine protease typically periplasmic contain C-terminal PDZ domain n=1 Tax=Coraliomargarita akajimensis (strain DSM 45221 / IAM 15411 / JCM 23193 / KCTC 12865 / 04OKA010-24) TaxID=583355 RepID=D5EMW7_CORAD|nr:serine protease [Coraliomargarita akajimensis]ADE55357.1 Trypsin-like protein serine protease typically periplasmic contain C-terminal PDZ domain [Coraliomargarita akajimensis DSM 45221]